MTKNDNIIEKDVGDRYPRLDFETKSEHQERLDRYADSIKMICNEPRDLRNIISLQIQLNSIDHRLLMLESYMYSIDKIINDQNESQD